MKKFSKCLNLIYGTFTIIISKYMLGRQRKIKYFKLGQRSNTIITVTVWTLGCYFYLGQYFPVKPLPTGYYCISIVWVHFLLKHSKSKNVRNNPKIYIHKMLIFDWLILFTRNELIIVTLNTLTNKHIKICTLKNCTLIWYKEEIKCWRDFYSDKQCR